MPTVDVPATATALEQAARVKASAALVFAECTAAKHDDLDACRDYLETLVNADHAFDLLVVRTTSEAYRARSGPASHLARTLDRVSQLTRSIPLEQARAVERLAEFTVRIAEGPQGKPGQPEVARRGLALTRAFRVFREALGMID